MFRRHAAPLYHYLLGLCRDRDLAEDLGQEAVMRLLRNNAAALRTWHDNPHGSFRGYLRTIARHLWIDHCKSAHRTRVVTLAEPPDLPDARDAREREASEATRMLQCLGIEKLPERDRHLLTLMLLGLTGRQIGAALDVREGHAWVLVHRVTAKLRGWAREMDARNGLQ
ncbi:MAG: sigma-70 family RNA polymerase sigma factor [Candidatus Eisenbacteria sp.]|nr:sigma-70 family RNA polymerase sigma factor [Candidatus Eisenbacteria bacterium]